jgi:hypothetical protein
MNLSNYKRAVWINEIRNPTDSETSFKYTIINIFKSDDIRDYHNLNLDLKVYEPSKKDKIYFFPGCDVPRYKVRIWGKDKDVSITNNVNKASHIIAGVKTVSNCINYSGYGMTEDSQVYCDWLDENYPLSLEIVELKNLIKAVGNDNVYFNRANFRGAYSKHGLGKLSTYHNKNQPLPTAATYGFTSLTGQMPGSTFENWVNISYITDEDLIKLNLILDPTSKVYSEKSLIEHVNEDSATIDQEMFKQIKAMFNSNSREDHLMALSIMSNCNVKPSLHFLLLLLQEFSHIILSLKEHKHVNFKSLLKYLALPRWDNLRVDDIIQCLMEKEELTMEIVKEVAEGVKEVMQKDFNTTHFKINSITVSEEVKNHILKRLEITTT